MAPLGPSVSGGGVDPFDHHASGLRVRARPATFFAPYPDIHPRKAQREHDRRFQTPELLCFSESGEKSYSNAPSYSSRAEIAFRFSIPVRPS